MYYHILCDQLDIAWQQIVATCCVFSNRESRYMALLTRFWRNLRSDKCWDTCFSQHCVRWKRRNYIFKSHCPLSTHHFSSTNLMHSSTNITSVHMRDMPRFKVTLQHTATYYYTLQHTATRCNTLQHAATHCNALQHTATQCNMGDAATSVLLLRNCHTLQHTATYCNIL